MDRAVSLAISYIYICQIIARYEIHNQLQFLAYVSTFPLFYTKYHFEADRHSDRDKPYKDNIGQHQSASTVSGLPTIQ